MLRTLDIGWLDGEWVVADKIGETYFNWRSTSDWQQVLAEHDKLTVRKVVADRRTATRLRRDRPNSKKIVS